VSVLSEKIKREIEEKGVVPDSQTGFRKGRGTMGNVYILDHLAKSVQKTKGGEDVRTVRRLQGGIRQGGHRENV
jgi:hypothetical protein